MHSTQFLLGDNDSAENAIPLTYNASLRCWSLFSSWTCGIRTSFEPQNSFVSVKRLWVSDMLDMQCGYDQANHLKINIYSVCILQYYNAIGSAVSSSRADQNNMCKLWMHIQANSLKLWTSYICMCMYNIVYCENSEARNAGTYAVWVDKEPDKKNERVKTISARAGAV